MNKLSITAGIALCAASAASAQTLVSSDITSDDNWSGEIVLDSTVFVKSGATLTIAPGTIVRGQPRDQAGLAGAPGSLIITQEGRIEAEGNPTNPIIFTTAAIDNDGDGIPDSNPANTFMAKWTSGDTFYDIDPLGSPLGETAAGPIPGSTTGTTGTDANVELWGGLIILGNAPTNLGTTGNSTPLVGDIEGLPASADTEYGGTIANDDSGVLRYVSVRHGGEVLGSANEINGITFGGVGFGTTVEFCEVYMNWDDGFEWFGGTVNGKYLAVTHSMDDSFDGDQGWVGQVQYALAVQPFFQGGSSGGDEAFEFDGTDPDQNNTIVSTSPVTTGDPVPFPGYAFANFTVVGPANATGLDATVGANGRALLRNEFSGDLYNGFMVGASGDAFSIPTPNPVVLDTITVVGGSVPTFGGNVTANNIETGNTAGLAGEDAAVVGGLDPRPIPGTFPSVNPGVSSSLELGGQFDSPPFVGAFDPNAAELWTTGWTALNLRGILVD